MKIGDILIIRSNGSIDLVGKNVVVTEAHEGYLFAGYLIRMRFDKKKVLSDYVHYVLSSPQIRGVINLTAKSTSGVNNINSKELGAFPLSLPSLKEQTEIVSQVGSLFTLADTLEEKIEAAKKRVDKLTQSILSKAFRGELVPQDSNDESAEKLLERIKAEQAKEKPKKKREKRVKKVDDSTKDLLKILKKEDKAVSAKKLLSLSAFSNEVDDLEEFFVLLKQLQVEKKIEVERRDDEDWISFRYEGNL